MNKNPGIEKDIWEDLNQKWRNLKDKGHNIEVDFQLITDPDDASSVLAIEVQQKIDSERVMLVVQNKVGEAHSTLGIKNMSIEKLMDIFEKQNQYQRIHGSSITTAVKFIDQKTGEIRKNDAPHKNERGTNLQPSYNDYYLLDAIREETERLVGESITEIQVIENSSNGAIRYYLSYK